MQIIKFPSKKLNKKKLITFILILVLLITFLILSIIYCFNSSFREFIDINILKKEISSNSLPYISINSNQDEFYYAYDKYFIVLSKNILHSYNSSGEEINKTDVNINSPIFSSNNKYVGIAEKDGNTIYLLSGNNIVWQKTIDGNISKISVNKNGYVSLIVSGTSYKSIVISFDNKGNELFKTYISNNLAIDAEISNDNKFLSIAEIDYSGSIIKSSVKNISIEKAKNDPTNSIIYTYTLDNNILLSNIKYQDKNNLICMCNDTIYLLDLANQSNRKIIDYESNFEFIDINLKNSFTYSSTENYTLINNSTINIFNIDSQDTAQYKLKGSIKSIYCNSEKIAINTNTEIYFIGLNGWLIKKYESYNDVNNILLGDSIAGIIYKDKIKLLEI